MKTIKLISFIIGSFLATSLNAQFFTDDFSNPGNWTQYGTTTLCCGSTLSPGTMQVNNGQLELRAFRASQTYRLNQNIGQTLNANDQWRIEFKITPLSANTDNGANFVLTDHTDHWFSDTAGDHNPNNTSSVQISYSDPLGSNNQLRMFIKGKYQSTWGPPSDRIFVFPNTTYYVRVERLSSTEVILSIYSDAARTNHITGSPVCHTIDGNIGGLNNFQLAANTIGSPSRESDLNVDDLEIFNNTIEECSPDCDVEANVEIIQDPESCEYTFINNSTVGPGNTFMGSVINFGDGTYDEIGLSGTIGHSYNPGGHYQPCITTFSYIFDGSEYICCSDTKCFEQTFEECDTPNESPAIPEAEDCQISPDFDFNIDCMGNVYFQDNSSMLFGNHLTTVVDFGDGSDPIEVGLGQPFQHTYASNSNYEVCITVFGYFWNGESFECCHEKVCKTLEVTTVGEGCDEPGFRLKSESSEEQQFSVSPNPVHSVLNIQLLEGLNTIRIMSLEGRLIKEFVDIDEKQANIQMSDLPNGVYLISIQNGQTIENKKIIKQ